MTFNIALNFEDGITRFIQCHAGEKVLDAAYRQKVNHNRWSGPSGRSAPGEPAPRRRLTPRRDNLHPDRIHRWRNGQVRQVNLLSDTAIELVVALDEPLAFLPGQYINIQVPGGSGGRRAAPAGLTTDSSCRQARYESENALRENPAAS
jgi:benzoate/toluate 1,2-dioxygenase reductase subunit